MRKRLSRRGGVHVPCRSAITPVVLPNRPAALQVRTALTGTLPPTYSLRTTASAVLGSGPTSVLVGRRADRSGCCTGSLPESAGAFAGRLDRSCTAFARGARSRTRPVRTAAIQSPGFLLEPRVYQALTLTHVAEPHPEKRRVALPPNGFAAQDMERLWSLVVATGGSRWQMSRARNRRKQAV